MRERHSHQRMEHATTWSDVGRSRSCAVQHRRERAVGALSSSVARSRTGTVDRERSVESRGYRYVRAEYSRERDPEYQLL